MSIITDALKKAERERELNAKRPLEEAAQVIPPEMKPQELSSRQMDAVTLEPSTGTVLPPRENKVRGRKPFQFLSLQPKEVLILVGMILSLVFVFILLPRWPSTDKNLSVIWRPADRGGFFRVNSAGGVLRSGLRVAPPSREGSEDSRFIKLPFSLSGISVLGENRYAVINNRIVQEGDAIDGALVKQILDREVVIETRSGDIKLKFTS